MGRQLRRPYFLGDSQASVTVLSMMCRWILLHLGQANVRKSWLNPLGSIALNLIGEPQAVHWGPWFCVSSICFAPLSSAPWVPQQATLRKPISWGR